MSEWTKKREAEVRARWFPKPPKDAVDIAVMLDALPADKYQEPTFRISYEDIKVLWADFSDALNEIARLRDEVAQLSEGVA